MLISTLNCEMWPNFSYRGVRSVQLLLLLLLLMVFSSENFGFSPPYAGIAGIALITVLQRQLTFNSTEGQKEFIPKMKVSFSLRDGSLIFPEEGVEDIYKY